MLLFWKKNSRGKNIKILIWSKEKNEFFFCFKSIFERQKQTCFNKKIKPNLKWKQYHHPFFVQYKKILIYLFPLYRMKKEKKIHSWVVLGAGLNSNGSNKTQPMLLGPGVNRTQQN